jgi:hypothetical protein
MFASTGERRSRDVYTPCHRGVYRTGYFLGSASRRILDLMLFPFRVIINREPRRSFGYRSHRSISTVRPELSSRLSGLSDRLRSLEHTLLGSEAMADLDSPAADRARWEVSAELVEALSDPDPGIRRMALGSIRDIGPESAAAMIVDALHDPDSSVRCAAATAAAELGASAAVFSLILSLDDPALEVRRTAKLAIEKITNRRIDFDPSGASAVRQKRIAGLKKWWKDERFTSLAAEVETIFSS